MTHACTPGLLLASLLALGCGASLQDRGPEVAEIPEIPAAELPAFVSAVSEVSEMVRDARLRRRVERRGLSIVDVAWEDTGRAEGSVLGPNISDLTLQLRWRDPDAGFAEALMPVIRHPNFIDRTADV